MLVPKERREVEDDIAEKGTDTAATGLRILTRPDPIKETDKNRDFIAQREGARKKHNGKERI